MRVVVRVAINEGWSRHEGLVPDGSDLECYALPKVNGETACRAQFWSHKLGIQIPRGRGLIWEIQTACGGGLK